MNGGKRNAVFKRGPEDDGGAVRNKFGNRVLEA
jgi:hypothetical protein